MALIEINRDPTARQVRQFSLFWLSGFLLVLAGLAVARYGSPAAAVALVIGAGTSIVLGLIRPDWMRRVFVAWMCAAFPIGWAISHLLLVVIYYLVITPIGLAMRATGYDPLARRIDRQATTYWTPRKPPTDPASYFRQF
jgi:hypothetical protein